MLRRGEEFLCLRRLGCLDLAEENGELILGHFVPAQERFERSHQEHLNTYQLGENVQIHCTAALAACFSEQSLTYPFADALPLPLSE